MGIFDSITSGIGDLFSSGTPATATTAATGGGIFGGLFSGESGKSIINASISTVGGLLTNHFAQEQKAELAQDAETARLDSQAFSAAESEKNREFQLALQALKGGGGGAQGPDRATIQAEILSRGADRENQILASLMQANNQALL